MIWFGIFIAALIAYELFVIIKNKTGGLWIFLAYAVITTAFGLLYYSNPLASSFSLLVLDLFKIKF